MHLCYTDSVKGCANIPGAEEHRAELRLHRAVLYHAQKGGNSMKLMIAIPMLDYIHHRFVRCLLALEQWLRSRGIEYEIDIEGGTLVYLAREKLAARAAQSTCTHVLWLDADMVFPPDILDGLHLPDKPVVCAAYCSRRPPFRPAVFSCLAPIRLADDTEGGVFEIMGCGFGCVLMEVGVLEKVFKRAGTCFTPTAAFGEDLAFCSRCYDARIPMYCNGDVRVGHIAQLDVYPQMRDALNSFQP